MKIEAMALDLCLLGQNNSTNCKSFQILWWYNREHDFIEVYILYISIDFIDYYLHLCCFQHRQLQPSCSLPSIFDISTLRICTDVLILFFSIMNFQPMHSPAFISSVLFNLTLEIVFFFFSFFPLSFSSFLNTSYFPSFFKSKGLVSKLILSARNLCNEDMKK